MRNNYGRGRSRDWDLRESNYRKGSKRRFNEELSGNAPDARGSTLHYLDLDKAEITNLGQGMKLVERVKRSFARDFDTIFSNAMDVLVANEEVDSKHSNSSANMARLATEEAMFNSPLSSDSDNPSNFFDLPAYEAVDSVVTSLRLKVMFVEEVVESLILTYVNEGQRAFEQDLSEAMEGSNFMRHAKNRS